MNITDRVVAAKKAYDDAMDLGAMQSDAFSTAITTALALTPQLDTFPVGPHAHSISPPIQPQFPPVRDPGFSHGWTLAGGSQVPSLEAPALAKEWRCFHCDEVFTTERDARLHFGMDQCSDPACKIKMGAEKSLLVALRRAETELQDAWAAIHKENTEAAKAYYSQQSRHGEQLRAAEELGFERGIADLGSIWSDLTALSNAANELASWAACINWRGGENQKDWLDELRQHIESVQALCKPYVPKKEAKL